ncbi:hypothetical protein KUTeg_022844 [Tegillarca granosa]|uniref:Uncharacterized protein n=1 Tax=Tegillarca granosa TaxID=220873 RepID=A0ABQ9E3P4_TEGGR|nr:hypothetical protein KUTeg_022844 [Tegillarca granosa]
MKNGLVSLTRIFCCKIPVLFRARQMWWSSSAQNALNRLNSLSRSRKIILGILVVLALIYYLGIFNLRSSKIKQSFPDGCIQDRIRMFHKQISSYDVVANHKIAGEETKYYPPYVGNGKVAVSLDGKSGLYIRLNRALSLPVRFYPLVGVSLQNDLTYQKKGIKLTSHPFLVCFNGVIKDANSQPLYTICFKLFINLPYQLGHVWGKHCVTIGSQVYAHRSRPSILIQDIKITNPLNYVTGYFYLFQRKAKNYIGETVYYSVTSGIVKTQTPEYVEMIAALKIDSQELRAEHIKVWKQIWKSGFGISQSKAAHALNGDKINTTFYYVLSNIPAPLHDVSTSAKAKQDITKALDYPDRCYSGHTTLVVTTWMITLEKQGCSVMVGAGAEGVLQAMMLSIGSLRFGNNHLEFAMEPKDLHRDIFFHRINYGNMTHLNISVIVGQDNKANIFVALDRNDKPYYACDAGCIDPPSPLTKELKQFPVKLTKPLTSILYITADKIHMEELKHAIHVKEIVEAPAHEHHVIALHKHGHHFGGLPTIFWVSIAFLVVIFHLFLCKLIYNEYCAGQDRFTRGRYIESDL